jgi:two-component system, NarL family, response regulator NreC
MPIRLVIADDHNVLRAGLIALLNAEPDLKVVGEAAGGERALELTAELRPDIVVMDISMPGMSGIEATRRIHEFCPFARILILTVHDDTLMLQGAIRAGASGYILKQAVKSELIDAIHCVFKGDMYIHSSLTRAFLSLLSPVTTPPAREPENLTPREREILQLLAQGYTNAQIADVLKVSVRTAEFHRGNITAKLNMHSRVELVRYALKSGLFSATL